MSERLKEDLFNVLDGSFLVNLYDGLQHKTLKRKESFRFIAHLKTYAKKHKLSLPDAYWGALRSAPLDIDDFNTSDRDSVALAASEMLFTVTTLPALHEILSGADADYMSTILAELKQYNSRYLSAKDKSESENVISKYIDAAVRRRFGNDEAMVTIKEPRALKRYPTATVWFSYYSQDECKPGMLWDGSVPRFERADLAKKLLGLNHYCVPDLDHRVAIALILPRAAIPKNTFLYRPNVLDGAGDRFRAAFGDLLPPRIDKAGRTLNLDRLGQGRKYRGATELVCRSFVPQQEIYFTVLGRFSEEANNPHGNKQYIECLRDETGGKRTQSSLNNMLDAIYTVDDERNLNV